MVHFFEKRDRWGHGSAFWVLLVMVFLTPIAFWSVSKITLENDVENWLPKDDPQAQILSWYQEVFPSEETILLAWTSSSLSDPRVEQFALKLEGQPDEDGIKRGGSPYIKSVTTPREALTEMVRRLKVEEGDDAGRDEVIRRMEGVLIGSGMFKVKLTEAGAADQNDTIAKLKAAAQNELDLKISISDPVSELQADLDDDVPSEAVAESDNEDDAELQTALDFVMTIPWKSHDFQVSWQGLLIKPKVRTQFAALAKSLRGPPTETDSKGPLLVEELFFQAGAPVACSVVLSEAGADDRTAAFEEIRRLAGEIGIPEPELRMGGSPVAGSRLNAGVQQVGWDPDYPITKFHKRSPFLLSVIVGLSLTFLLLRNIRLSVLVQVVALYTMILASGIVPLTGGSMNMVLAVMPTLLMVLTVSAAIHVANYWKHATVTHPEKPVIEAIQQAKVPCLLASTTTAIGLISLGTSPLVPVRDFGIYSAIGCLLSLVVVLFCFPALLLYWPGKKTVQEQKTGSTGWNKLARFLTRRAGLVSLACVILFFGCTAGLQHFKTETKVIRYFPDDSRIVQDYHYLEEAMAGIIGVDVVVRFSNDASDPNDVSEEGQQRELIFIERMELVRQIQEKIRQHPEVSGSLSLADFQPKTERPDLSGLSTFKRLTTVKEYNTRSEKVEETVMEEGSAARSFITIAKADATQVSEDGKPLHLANEELWKISAQVAIMSDSNYDHLTEELANLVRSETENYSGVDHVVTGMVPVFLRTQQAVLESLILSFGLAFGLIAIVMMVLLKNPIAGLLTMLPNLLPVGVVFGLISWYGLAVDMGTMITASVALGIAIDGTLHLMTWFRDGIRSGLGRNEAVEKALTHCGPAMWQTSLIVGLGLSMLAFGDILLVSRFGWLMASLIGMALIADVIFLPALLAGPLGLLLERDHQRRQKKQTTPITDTTAPLPGTEDDTQEEVAVTTDTTPQNSSVPKPHQRTSIETSSQPVDRP